MKRFDRQIAHVAYGALLFMCSCGDDTTTSPPGAAGNPSGMAGMATAANAGVGGGTAGGAQAGSGGAAAGSVTVPPLMPLITGHVSNFAFKALDSSRPSMDTCDAPKAEVGERTTIAGQSGTLYSTPCGSEPYLVDGSGDQLTAYRLMNGAIVGSYEYVHAPVAEGEQWTTNGAEYEWREVVAGLDVPAGSFDDCWERYAEDLSLVYCRGVGLVRMTSTPKNYVLELTQKNF
jgi:hypothetical protein